MYRELFGKKVIRMAVNPLSNRYTLLNGNSSVRHTPINNLFVTTRLQHGSDEHDSTPGSIRVKFIKKDGTVVDTMARQGEIALRKCLYELPA